MNKETIDHIDECLEDLRLGINFLHPIEASFGEWGVASQNDIVNKVKENFKKLQEAIHAMKNNNGKTRIT